MQSEPRVYMKTTCTSVKFDNFHNKFLETSFLLFLQESKLDRSMYSSWAQEILLCYLCKKPASRCCNNCQVDICLNCINKHAEELDSLSHEIASYKNRKIQLVFSRCQHHSDRRCEAYCHPCKTPVCNKCLIGPHKLHNAEDIVSFVESKKQDIKKKTQELEEKLIPTYQTDDMNFQNKISETTKKFTKLEQENEALRKIWQNEVDDIFDKFKSMIFSRKESDLNTLTTKQALVRKLIPGMIQTVDENKDILNSNQASDVANYAQKETPTQCNERSINPDFAVKIPSLLTKTLQGKELCIEMDNVKATLSRTPLLSLSAEVPYLSTESVFKKAKIIATIATNFNPLCRVTCVGKAKAWISSDKNFITQVDYRGVKSVRDNSITCKHRPLDMSLTRLGELVFSDSRTISIVKQGKVEIFITTPRGWEPRGVCCSRSGDILVSVFNAKRNKIIRYQGKKVKQEIEKDEHGNTIFAEGDYMLFVSENSNGDICVSDGNSDKVVVVDKRGQPRFRYDGTQARRRESFDPRCIQTDIHGHIIVADLNNDCLHILDQNGNLLRCLINCELDTPQGLSVDKEGRLWVGLFRSGEIKVIEYLE